MSDEGQTGIYKLLSTLTSRLQDPLVVIAGQASLDTDLPQDRLEKIQKSADEMLNTIDDIMLSTRIINNKAEIVPKSFDIRRSIKNAQEELRDYLKNKKHSIAVKTNRKLPLAIGDEFASQILIINLIKHCSELASSESELTISLRMLLRMSSSCLSVVEGLNINLNSHNRSINNSGDD
jgi:signal transduction histidine kinase